MEDLDVTYCQRSYEAHQIMRILRAKIKTSEQHCNPMQRDLTHLYTDKGRGRAATLFA